MSFFETVGYGDADSSSNSPLSILHAVPILAFSTLVLIFALVERIPIENATRLAAEIGWKFDLNIRLDEEAGAVGDDLQEIESELRRGLPGTRAHSSHNYAVHKLL